MSTAAQLSLNSGGFRSSDSTGFHQWVNEASMCPPNKGYMLKFSLPLGGPLGGMVYLKEVRSLGQALKVSIRISVFTVFAAGTEEKGSFLCCVHWPWYLELPRAQHRRAKHTDWSLWFVESKIHLPCWKLSVFGVLSQQWKDNTSFIQIHYPILLKDTCWSHKHVLFHSSGI